MWRPPSPPRRPSSWPAGATAERQRRRLVLLATWHALWALLEAVDGGDRRSGRPFTTPPGPGADGDGVVLDAARVRGRPGGRDLLRRAAELWGGRYDPATGRWTGCRLGLDPDDWRGFVC